MSIVASSVLAILFNLWVANSVTTILPVVDGWAVLSRIVDLKTGLITWDEFIFKPHGAHLHAIVYVLAWLDFTINGGNQRLMYAASICAVLGFAALIGAAIWKWGKIHNNNININIMCGGVSALLMTSLVDAETLIQPFQAVLSISRLSYIGLLTLYVVALSRNKTKLYSLTTVISIIAVTFHGSGYIFAVLIIVSHLILNRSTKRLALSLLPLFTVIAVQACYSTGKSELQQITEILNPQSVVEFIKGTAAYFATPFSALRDRISTLTLTVIGAVLFLCTAGISITTSLILFKEGKGILRTKKINESGNYSKLQLELIACAFLTALFLLMSSAAASLFWIVRTLHNSTIPAHIYVLDSARYTAYSSLAPVLLIGVLLLFPSRLKGILFLLLAALVLTAIVPAIKVGKSYTLDDALNIAAAALGVGISPIHPEAEAVWPIAATDWYWSTNLPKTVAYLKNKQKSAWSVLPPLDAIVDGPVERFPLTLSYIRRLEGDVPRGRCGIRATLPLSPSYLAKGSIYALVNSNRMVIGYITLLRHQFESTGRRFEGYIRCNAMERLTGPIFMSPSKLPWHYGEQRAKEFATSINITDDTWNKGFARNWAGFFVKDTSENAALFRKGSLLRFGSGDIRTVSRVSNENGYLNVFFDGGPIDGGVAGFPETIENLTE